ncbi:hypothetical protein FRX31_006405 [Thalictrum thalictroides]|uniref:Uncharacterized protein n=1 Tax=Thalictrum thalictroides TaxID=46969 RepID=A0A7J6X4L5_THATH|nr:hypothetical protein FRX31_006405 [Thalictrum thalictroides]
MRQTPWCAQPSFPLPAGNLRVRVPLPPFFFVKVASKKVPCLFSLVTPTIATNSSEYLWDVRGCTLSSHSNKPNHLPPPSVVEALNIPLEPFSVMRILPSGEALTFLSNSISFFSATENLHHLSFILPPPKIRRKNNPIYTR